MKISDRGNVKLGKRTITLNRPVGVTCPPDCPFLHNGCYAEFTEHRWQHTRFYAEHNLVVYKQEVVELIQKAIRLKKSIRIHERGDFYRNGKLDKRYIKAWKLALAEFSWEEICNIWTYTHIYVQELAELQHHGIHMYASVHTYSDYLKAKRAGFVLFAWVTDIQKNHRQDNRDKPKFIKLPTGNTLICPSQRMGTDKVTCSSCRWCVRGKGNIAFLVH